MSAMKQFFIDRTELIVSQPGWVGSVEDAEDLALAIPIDGNLVLDTFDAIVDSPRWDGHVQDEHSLMLSLSPAKGLAGKFMRRQAGLGVTSNMGEGVFADN